MKTLKEIADELDVSMAAVSYVYNNKWKQNRINPALAEKISKKLKKEKYRPNSLGLQLKTKKTRTIGIVLGDLTRTFNLNILSGIEKVLTEKGYFSLVCSSNLGRLEKKQLEILSDRNIDGIIFSPHKNGRTTFDTVKELIKDRLPVVLVDNYLPEVNMDFVVSDNYLGTYQAINYLIKSGRRKIAYMGSSKHLTALDERFRGYEDALKDEGIPLNRKLLWKKTTKFQNVYSAMKEMFSEEKPDALFVESLHYFKEGFRFFLENGHKVPDDITLTGFDSVDLNLSEIQEVDLPSIVRQPIPFVEQRGTEIGEIAAGIILDRISGKKKEPSQIFLKPELKFFNGKEHNGKRI